MSYAASKLSQSFDGREECINVTNQKTKLGLVSLFTFLEGKVETGPSGAL